MRLLLLLSSFGLPFVLWAKQTDDILACWRDTAQKQAQQTPDPFLKDIFNYAEQVFSNPEVHPEEIGLQFFQQQLVDQLTSVPPQKWQDPEFVKQMVTIFCQQYYSQVAPFCVEGFFAIQKEVDKYFKHHEAKIKSMAEEILKNPNAKWEDLVGNYDFGPEKITDLNFHYAPYYFLPSDDPIFQIRKKLFPGFDIDIPNFAYNEAGRKIGMLVNIATPDKREQFYIAPFVKSEVVVLFPYPFVFGGVDPEIWNRQFR